MTNKEKLNIWYNDQQENHGLVDIKFFPGEISTSSEESFCGSILIALKQDEQGLSKEIEEL